MIQHNAGLTDSHPYASGPINWPFLLSGISFWTSAAKDKEQVYLIGNFVDWWFCVLALSVFVGILGAEQLARRRGIQAIPERELAAEGLVTLISCTNMLTLPPCAYSRRSQPAVQYWRFLPFGLVLPLRPVLDDEQTAFPASVSSQEAIPDGS